MAKHLELGANGEEMAANFLRGRGMTIVERGVRYRFGELDLVARQGREWVFVEVKTRRGDRMGSAAEAFSPAKALRMRRAVEAYAREHDLFDEAIRCDLVAIDIAPDGVPAITHYPGGIAW